MKELLLSVMIIAPEWSIHGDGAVAIYENKLVFTKDNTITTIPWDGDIAEAERTIRSWLQWWMNPDDAEYYARYIVDIATDPDDDRNYAVIWWNYCDDTPGCEEDWVIEAETIRVI